MECNCRKDKTRNIVKLVIENPEEFDTSVWLEKSGFSKDEYAKWFNHVQDALQDIYDYIDGRKPKSACDLYALSDIINTLNIMTIEVK